MINLTSNNKLKFGDIGHLRLDYTRRFSRRQVEVQLIEATGEEVLRINPMQLLLP